MAFVRKGIWLIHLSKLITLIRKNLKKGKGLFVVNDKHTMDSVELQRYLEHCHNNY